MEVTRRRGRRRKKLLDDLKDRRGYSHLKEEALDRTMWRHRFGGGFGPVVRQNTEWMNEWMNELALYSVCSPGLVKSCNYFGVSCCSAVRDKRRSSLFTTLNRGLRSLSAAADFRTVLHTIASSASNKMQTAASCVLQTDLPCGQHGMAEELTEKLYEKVRDCVFLYGPGHPQ